MKPPENLVRPCNDPNSPSRPWFPGTTLFVFFWRQREPTIPEFHSTSITTINPPPPFSSALLLVVWCGIWQWISHLPSSRAVQTTS